MALLTKKQSIINLMIFKVIIGLYNHYSFIFILAALITFQLIVVLLNKFKLGVLNIELSSRRIVWPDIIIFRATVTWKHFFPIKRVIFIIA